MGPNAVRRHHGPSQCLVNLEIPVVMFKCLGDGRENTNHMGQGGRNRLNQRHYSLSRSCLCDTPRMAQHHFRNNAEGKKYISCLQEGMEKDNPPGSLAVTLWSDGSDGGVIAVPGRRLGGDGVRVLNRFL